MSLENFGKVTQTSCTWFVTVKDGKFKVLNGGKPYTGKLVGDPDLIAQYENSGGVTTTTAAPTGELATARVMPEGAGSPAPSARSGPFASSVSSTTGPSARHGTGCSCRW